MFNTKLRTFQHCVHKNLGLGAIQSNTSNRNTFYHKLPLNRSKQKSKQSTGETGHASSTSLPLCFSLSQGSRRQGSTTLAYCLDSVEVRAHIPV